MPSTVHQFSGDASSMRRLLDDLQQRGFVRGKYSRWGVPVFSGYAPDCAPQATSEATALQRRFVACAYATPSPGDDLCASWVEQSFSRLGLGVVLGDAAHLYGSYCHFLDLRDLKVGMIVAVAAHPYSASGLRHGHVGLYIGDAKIMDCANNEVRVVPLDLWLVSYGLMAEPRWGWLGSIGLS